MNKAGVGGKRRKKERVGMNQEGIRLYTRLEKKIGSRAETEMIRF